MSGRPRTEIPPLALNRVRAAAALDLEGKAFDSYVRPHIKSVFVGGTERWPVKELERWLDRQMRAVVGSARQVNGRGAAGTAPDPAPGGKS
jgi:hypothetical protein